MAFQGSHLFAFYVRLILMHTPAGHIIIIIIISLHNSATPRRHLKSTLRLKTIKRVFKCCGLNKDEIA